MELTAEQALLLEGEAEGGSWRGGWSQAEQTPHLAHTQVSQCCLGVSKMLYPRHGQGTGVQVKKVASKSTAEEQ